MNTPKLLPGHPFPKIVVKDSNGAPIQLGLPIQNYTWQAVFVYRGAHCPMCTRYINQLEQHLPDFARSDVEVVAVSADSSEQYAGHRQQLDVGFPIFHGLTEQHMQALGLFISDPRSEKETDHRFAEPALFVVNEQGTLHVVDISNNPFVRPEIDTLARGLKWIRDPENHYPIRGTLQY